MGLLGFRVQIVVLIEVVASARTSDNLDSPEVALLGLEFDGLVQFD